MPIRVSRQSVDEALDQIDRDGVPPRRRSTGYCMVARDRHYPPKLVLGIATGGKKLNGGEPTNRPLSEHYEIVECKGRHKYGARHWLMALGTNSNLWESCHEDGVARIGYDRPGVGDLSRYESQEQLKQLGLGTHASLACWEFSHVMKPGDVLFVKRGTKLILGHGVVKSGYRFDDARTEFKHVRDVEWLSKTEGVTARKKPLVTKTLTDITRDHELVAAIERALKGGHGPPPPKGPSFPPNDLFLPDDQIERLVELLKRKKNLVLQGPPGTGKTYVAQRLAWRLANEKSSERIEVVQFHQSYGYEEFVRGYRPTENGGFALRDGPFLAFCERARADRKRPHVLVIDEINRGNLSRIFGELLMLIEADKRNPDYAVKMAYAHDNESPFYVPDNVYVIGTMNTADRSLALVDYALRRRFVFWSVKPAFGNDHFLSHLDENRVPVWLRDRIRDRFEALNGQIGEDKQLGDGFQIGHSYFCGPPKGLTTRDEWSQWYTTVVRYEIEPLLREYWFDAEERADDAVGKLRASN